MVVDKKRYLVSARILCGEFFDLPAGDAFITMREPDTKTTFHLEQVFKSGDTQRIVKEFVEAMPDLIVDHNFESEPGKGLTAAEVAALVADKIDLFLAVVDQYKDKVLFTLGKKSGAN
jgi:hypothetical protein